MTSKRPEEIPVQPFFTHHEFWAAKRQMESLEVKKTMIGISENETLELEEYQLREKKYYEQNKKIKK